MRARTFVLTALFATVAIPAAAAQPLAFAKERLARIDQTFQRYVDEGRIAGAVTLVMHRGVVVQQGAYGWADKEAGRRMTADAVFRIASQTKALTSVAVMLLVEEGKVGLTEPVSRWLPNFARTMVAVKSDTGRALVPAKRPITIKDLLTHTAGISYGTDSLVSAQYAGKALGPAAGFGWYTADKSEPICETMDRLGTLPFVAQPGEAFVYGYNTDILGCVVERASGLPLDEFFRKRITGPLGMRDTYFFLPPEQRSRLTAVYAVEDGKLVRAIDGPRGQGNYVDGPRRSFAGGAGVVSTARDYARFLEMLRRGGELEGVRLLGPKTVALMTMNQSGTLFPVPGLGFGLGFQTVDRPGANGYASVGAYGWGGAYYSQYLVDPTEGLVIVFMSQHLPNGGSDLGTKFVTLVYQALLPAPCSPAPCRR